MRRTSAVPAVLLAAALTGCAGAADEGKPTGSAQPTAPSRQAAPADPAPRTAAEFLARAEAAMAGHKGWTFTVKGREGLVLRGQENAATYTATVRRTTGDSWALHSTGSALSKGVRKPEEIYVADGTAYVKKGTEAWELRARTTTAPLTGVRDRGVVQKALRELAPTLRQLRTAGVTAPEIRYEQDVTERTLGTYVGTVARPEGLG